jgi:hypothetical protein
MSGEDTQLENDSATSSIKATNYDACCSGGSGPCLEVSGSIKAGAMVVTKACDRSAAQIFSYDPADCQFTIDQDLCLVVAEKSVTQSGLKRSISLQDRSSTEATRREWAVVNLDTTTITACSATDMLPSSAASISTLAPGTKVPMVHAVTIALAAIVTPMT